MFKSQQEALRTAFTQVLGSVPVKGTLIIDAEQRAAIGELMMGWLKEGMWSIKDGTRAAAQPLSYITGTNPTDLIQAWTLPRKKTSDVKDAAVNPVAAPAPSFIDQVQSAVKAGLITEEMAKAAVLKHLGIAV